VELVHLLPSKVFRRCVQVIIASQNEGLARVLHFLGTVPEHQTSMEIVLAGQLISLSMQLNQGILKGIFRIPIEFYAGSCKCARGDVSLIRTAIRKLGCRRQQDTALLHFFGYRNAHARSGIRPQFPARIPRETNAAWFLPDSNLFGVLLIHSEHLRTEMGLPAWD